MAAHYWRLLLFCELGFAVAVAMLLRAAFNITLAPAMLTGLTVWLLLPGALAGVSFAVAGVMSPPQRSSGKCIGLLRAWVRESTAVARATLAMSVEPWHSFEYIGLPDALPRPARPVLLVHGVVCNRGVWRPMAQALRAHGFGPIRAVNLEPLLANIDAHAMHVAHEIRQLRRDSGGARVAIVAHSMGGLAARAALRLLEPHDISQIVTLGCPHHGSVLARLLPGLPYRQMEPDSDWLSGLNAAQEGRLPVPVTCIYSADDNLIRPPSSAALEGASRIELRGVGHLSLLTTRPAINCTLAALTGSLAGQEPCLT
jgi:pimeloyl-ACP methyl ester carboxylesterase